ncbi:hypothetical protein [Furfurilactobacillus curtus]|uniref:Uncharacterized protein n=1 Tax=Furfurilactobacillus curtus TaxID=1746200 RepID=A0ABQ5JNP0_9LACO
MTQILTAIKASAMNYDILMALILIPLLIWLGIGNHADVAVEKVSQAGMWLLSKVFG